MFIYLVIFLFPFKAFGVFGLCQIHALVDYLRSKMPQSDFETLFRGLIISIITVSCSIGGILTVTGEFSKFTYENQMPISTPFLGRISPWTGRFYSLLDPSYAKNHIPIIASVSEHQPTSWSSFYFDLQILVFLFPTGLYFCFSKLTDSNTFLILYGVTSLYFAVSKFVYIFLMHTNVSSIY